MSTAQAQVIEQPNPTPSPTPAPAPAPVPNASPPASSEGGDPAPSQFAIPDEYKDRGWVKKYGATLKSPEDVIKLLDSTQSQLGKKFAAPDFTTASPEEINEYFAQIRPKDAGEYQFNEESHLDDTTKELYRGMLYESGLPKAVGDGLIKKFEAYEAAKLEELYSEKGFDGVLEKSFGADWKQQGGKAAAIIKEHLSAEDNELLEKVPNEFLGLFYRMTGKMAEAYGVKETATAASDTPTAGRTDLVKLRSDLRKQIREIDARPHTADEKQALVSQLDATYQNKR